jgi:hypothetical protein
MSAFLNLKHTRVYQRLRNQQECRMWLLCSLRIGICKDIRLYVTRFLYDIMHELETFPDQGIRSWSNTQMKLYYALQQTHICFYRAPNNNSTQIVIAGIIASIMCNATSEIRIGILTSCKDKSIELMNQIYCFSEEKVFMNAQTSCRIGTNLVSVVTFSPREWSMSKCHVYFVLGMDTATIEPIVFSHLFPLLQKSRARFVLCGADGDSMCRIAKCPIVE